MQRLDQAVALGAGEVGPFTQMASRAVAGDGLLEACLAFPTDRERRQRGDQGDVLDCRREQGGGEIAACLLVFAGHGDELVYCHGPVDGEHLDAARLQAEVEGIFGWQATGHQQGIHVAAGQHLGQFFSVAGSSSEQTISS